MSLATPGVFAPYVFHLHINRLFYRFILCSYDHIEDFIRDYFFSVSYLAQIVVCLNIWNRADKLSRSCPKSHAAIIKIVFA
jgi:hypothetical protein